MCDDLDMKIVGDGPFSEPAETSQADADAAEFAREKESGLLDKAKELGRRMVEEFRRADGQFAFGSDGETDSLLAIQRQILLAFVVTVGVERFCISRLTAQTARQSFYNCLKEQSPALYEEVGGGGAFSFYYLAYRRGGEVERRMGQTFAMLCARDGDPVYQELGEALYCWFLSVVEQKARELGVGK